MEAPGAISRPGTTTKSTTTESGMIQSSLNYLLVCFGRNFVDVNIRLCVSHEGLIHRLSCALSEFVLQSLRSFATSLDRVDKLGHNGEYVTDNTEVGDVEDRGVGILIDCDDCFRGLHARAVLDRTRYAKRDI